MGDGSWIDMARLMGEVRAHQQALEALATTVQRIGARLDELLAEGAAELDDDGERQYERRMGQQTQAPEQLVAVRPDLRGVADGAHRELGVVRTQREVLRRVATALGVPVVVRDLHGAIVRHAEDAARRARVAEAAAKDLRERLERRWSELIEAREPLRDACEERDQAVATLLAVREALEAGQWARAMEAAGCGEEADRG